MHRTSVRPAPLDFFLPSAYPSYGIDRRKDITLPHIQQLEPIYLGTTVRDGLPTPPADRMATTYPHPQYNDYPARRDSAYAGAVSSGGNYVAANSQPRSYYSSLSQPPLLSVPGTNKEIEGIQVVRSQPQSPAQQTRSSSLAAPEAQPRRKSADMIRPNLQIPRKISDSGGSLAEFAAQITSLFWFEATDVLNKIESWAYSSSPLPRIRDEALPTTGFRKWVVTILSTTQVTENVIILALLFIYRLKKLNPQVKGRKGSEYRLLTVALMLGNKFLDDNTYTNKTWAEVSGISVTEIHVMEVEFLSNMRYSLLASAEQWEDWQIKLRKYYSYCEATSKPTYLQTSPQHIGIPSPTSNQSSPLSLNLSYPSSSTLSSGYLNNHQWSSSNSSPRTAHSPLPSLPPFDQHPYNNRKRGFEGEPEEPVAKRITRSMGPASVYNPNIPPLRLEPPRLPVPSNLNMSTSQPMNHGYNTSTNIPQNVPLLPPLTGRSMAPTTPTSWATQLPMLTPTGSRNANGHTTPSRHQSPHSVQELLAYGSSPLQGSNSPLDMYNRSSPYKPVRQVNYLLHPPPNATMHGYPINPNQISYYTLGKREYRNGVISDSYAPPHSYPQQLPVLLQPNFRA